VFWVFTFASTIILFFWLSTHHLTNVHRQHGELYGASVFGGGILERIGEVSLFNKVMWTIITLAAIYLIVEHLVVGQIY
jgi:hypothetical protein